MRRKHLPMTAARYLLRAGAAGVVAGLAVLGLPGGTALAATGVSTATLQVSSLSASATDVSYTVNFATPSAMTSGTSTITLHAPSGTVFPAPSGTCYRVYDDPGGGAFGTSGCGTVTLTGTTAVITVPLGIAAGDPVSVLVPGVSNPTSAGNKTLTVSTSAATKSASLHYTLVAKRSVTHAVLQVSSASAAATGVTYSVTFTSADRLTASSRVTVKFPAGTAMSAGGCNVVNWTDDTNGSHSCAGYSATGTTATLTTMLTNPGDTITITFGGMGSTTTTTGSHNVTLSTTSDPKTVTLSYSLTAKRAVTNKFLQLSSYTAGKPNVTWSVGFTAPDRLIDTGNGIGSSAVTIKAPAGTTLPTGSCAYMFIDTDVAQDGAQGPEDCANATVTGTTAVITAGFNTNAGNTLFVVIKGVTNPFGHEFHQRLDERRPQGRDASAHRPDGDERHRPAEFHVGLGDTGHVHADLRIDRGAHQRDVDSDADLRGSEVPGVLVHRCVRRRRRHHRHGGGAVPAARKLTGPVHHAGGQGADHEQGRRAHGGSPGRHQRGHERHQDRSR